MVADPVIFRDLAYVFVAAVLGAILARLARQPLILGYVVAGVLISPLTPGPSVSDPHSFETFAEIGVILLMFSIGIEFSLRDLVRVKWVAILGGPLGILLSVGLGVSAGWLVGWTLLEGIVVGVVVSVASTLVLARLLLDRGELHTRHGRIMIGITLVEDLAVVVLIVILPRLGALDAGRLLSIAGALGIGIAILVPFFYLAAKVVPRLLTYVARMQSQEVFLLVALAIALGTAALTQAVGLSLALGAFLAGLLISESDYAHETLARLLSLRDAFVALFFVTVGALLNPAAAVENLPLLGVIVGLVMIGKLVIWTGVVALFRQPLATALLVGVGLTQIGEFSFILIQVARSAGHVGDDIYNATLAASLLTILGNALLVRFVPAWIGRTAAWPRDAAAAPAEVPGLADHVVVCGFGRVGSQVAEALETFRTPYVAIDADPDIVRNVRRRGVRCVFGDASSEHILDAAGVAGAALVVVAVPQVERAYLAVRHVRSRHPDVPILARAHTFADRDRLTSAGATEVIQPEVEAASTLIRHALRRLDLPRERVLEYLERFRVAMDDALPGAPPGEALPQIADVLLLEAPRLTDQSLRQSRIRESFGVTVVALTRSNGDVVLHPPPETILRPRDSVRVFGRPDQIEAFRREATGGGYRSAGAEMA
jgi:CPA2 family monovalent cation:H+ antiporter-2